MTVKYPKIVVQLVGTDGNAFAIMGKVKTALKKGGIAQDEIASFFSEAMSGDYNHLLQVCMAWVTVK